MKIKKTICKLKQVNICLSLLNFITEMKFIANKPFLNLQLWRECYPTISQYPAQCCQGFQALKMRYNRQPKRMIKRELILFQLTHKQMVENLELCEDATEYEFCSLIGTLHIYRRSINNQWSCAGCNEQKLIQ